MYRVRCVYPLWSLLTHGFGALFHTDYFAISVSCADILPPTAAIIQPVVMALLPELAGNRSTSYTSTIYIYLDCAHILEKWLSRFATVIHWNKLRLMKCMRLSVYANTSTIVVRLCRPPIRLHPFSAANRRPWAVRPDGCCLAAVCDDYRRRADRSVAVRHQIAIAGRAIPSAMAIDCGGGLLCRLRCSVSIRG